MQFEGFAMDPSERERPECFLVLLTVEELKCGNRTSSVGMRGSRGKQLTRWLVMDHDLYQDHGLLSSIAGFLVDSSIFVSLWYKCQFPGKQNENSLHLQTQQVDDAVYLPMMKSTQ